MIVPTEGCLPTLAEMMFASHIGVTADIGALGEDALAALFNEELGAVLQVKASDFDVVKRHFSRAGLGAEFYRLGILNRAGRLIIAAKGREIYSESGIALQRMWSETTYHLQGCATTRNARSRNMTAFSMPRIRGST